MAGRMLLATIVLALCGGFAVTAQASDDQIQPTIQLWRRTQSAQMVGGRPPKALDTVAACGIDSMFAKLSQVRNAPDCQAGCAGGVCPPNWMPSGDDVCSADCGVIFEPFCISLRSATRAS